ncbi:hypothetical protein HYDPIDRAFT_117483 [Hydnomerulius pinastri MD-312]|uniref:Uncharacterized protein n=1 Tax=Hydnomerulius pinastri MD-312 TaxID=994086 RepID=A0A0C9W2M2_9AGAM|nr:hypothetical protein HYDPIDRAFT_117483 [Hydnomerulius pinastri MD-312]
MDTPSGAKVEDSLSLLDRGLRHWISITQSEVRLSQDRSQFCGRISKGICDPLNICRP